jgi:phage virion morphogenesis protein
MPGSRLDGNWVSLSRAIRNLEPSHQDLKTLNSRLGMVLEQSTKERFEEEKDPDGGAWEPLAASTVEARAKRRTKGRYKTKRGQISARARRIMEQAAILKDTGRMMRSITHKARPEGVAVGTNLVQGGIHQFGGKAGRGKKVEIPARPYLGISTPDKEDIQNVLVEFIEERSGNDN